MASSLNHGVPETIFISSLPSVVMFIPFVVLVPCSEIISYNSQLSACTHTHKTLRNVCACVLIFNGTYMQLLHDINNNIN